MTRVSLVSRWRVALCLFAMAGLAARAQMPEALPLRADATLTLFDALANGRFEARLRPRFNRIEEDRKPATTEAFTARAVVGWKSAPFHGLRMAVELIHSDRIGPKRFNDNPRVASPYPLLPDPRFAGVNQAWIEHVSPLANIRVGRQTLRLDNERFVSDNDFRQIPIVFTGATARAPVGAETELRFGHLVRVRSSRGIASRLKLSYLQAAWNPAEGQALLGYFLWHDQPQVSAQTGLANSSYRVAGVRWDGSFGGPHGRWLYHLEAAWQHGFAGGDDAIRARYLRVGGGWSGSEWTVRVDHEIKGSNAGRYGLQTPFTDLYAYNGWALQFVTTPHEGLRDSWLSVRKPWGVVDLFGELHRFRADAGGAKLGRELDIGLRWRLASDTRLIAQTARYRQAGANVEKLWVAVDWRY